MDPLGGGIADSVYPMNGPHDLGIVEFYFEKYYVFPDNIQEI